MRREELAEAEDPEPGERARILVIQCWMASILFEIGADPHANAIVEAVARWLPLGDASPC